MHAAVRQGVALATCSLIALLGTATATAAADQPFPNGFWSAPLAAGAPLDPATPTIAASIATQAAKNPGFSVRQWNSRIYRVPVGQPPVKVVVDGTSNAVLVLQAALDSAGGVPIPPGAQPSSLPAGPAPDTDSELVVYQPDWSDGSGRGTGRVWEFWRASSPQQNAPGAPPLPWGEPSHGDSAWHVRWGGRISYTSTSPGHPVDRGLSAPNVAARIANAGTDPGFEAKSWLATATSLPLLGGMITFEDWRRGVIDHAIGLAVKRDSLRKGVFNWPAQRSDGRFAGAPIVEGTRLRLPADYPIDAGAPKLIRMVEQAAKTYGFVVWDGGGGPAIRMEQQQAGSPQGACPGATCTNAWLQPGGAFYNDAGKFVFPVDMAKLFPWGRLQALAPAS